MIPMIAGLGVQELLVILLICVLLFGATKLPQIGRGMGEGIRNFKKGLKGGEDDAANPAEETNPTRPS
jgi:sec-independent protein translocase protein TatA